MVSAAKLIRTQLASAKWGPPPQRLFV
jgi:hypothetical protein